MQWCPIYLAKAVSYSHKIVMNHPKGYFRKFKMVPEAEEVGHSLHTTAAVEEEEVAAAAELWLLFEVPGVTASCKNRAFPANLSAATHWPMPNVKKTLIPSVN